MMQTRIKLLAVLVIGIFINAPLETHASIPLDQWFDSYGNISWDEEKVHLENFAKYLIEQPDYVGYIVVYVGKREKWKSLERRVERAKNYLIRILCVDKERVIIVQAPRRDITKFVLQPVPKEFRPPVF